MAEQREIRYSVRLDPALLAEVRRVAAQEDRSINSLIARAVRLYVEEAKKRDR